MHLAEAHRLLKSSGQIVYAHYDWDSQTIDGTDKHLVRRIVQSFNDWQQNWMGACDAWMGRRLWSTFQERRAVSGQYPRAGADRNRFRAGAVRL